MEQIINLDLGWLSEVETSLATASQEYSAFFEKSRYEGRPAFDSAFCLV
jgi:hypothetical protein